MPNQRPNEPIAPATIPGRPLDPKIPSDESSDREESDISQFGAVPGAELKIPDRSGELAVQESLDPEQSTTAANSSDAPAEARDDEGNVAMGKAGRDQAAPAARRDADAGSQ